MTSENKVILQIEPGVMLNRKVIGLVFTILVVAKIVCIYGLVNLRRLEADGRNLDEVEKLVKDGDPMVLKMTSKLVLDGVEDWLDCEEVCIA